MAATREEDVSSKLENEPVGHDARAMKKATDQVRVLAAASGAGGDSAGDADAIKPAQTDEEEEQSPVVDFTADGLPGHQVCRERDLPPDGQADDDDDDDDDELEDGKGARQVHARPPHCGDQVRVAGRRPERGGVRRH